MTERETRVKADFDAETATHQLEVIRDDGVYRHLRFRREDKSSFYYYDLLTWPGYLVICGDAGDYMFSRTRDMFEFFESDSGRINPDYWAQKLQGDSGRSGAQSYSHDVFAGQLYSWCRDEAEHYSDGLVYESLLRGAVERELLYGYTDSEHEARERIEAVNDGYSPLSVYEFDNSVQVFTDTWEWDFRDFDHRYLWCCWAIVAGIKQYRKAATAVARNHQGERGAS